MESGLEGPQSPYVMDSTGQKIPESFDLLVMEDEVGLMQRMSTGLLKKAGEFIVKVVGRSGDEYFAQTKADGKIINSGPHIVPTGRLIINLQRKTE